VSTKNKFLVLFEDGTTRFVNAFISVEDVPGRFLFLAKDGRITETLQAVERVTADIPNPDAQ
jgi:hypothetical protein